MGYLPRCARSSHHEYSALRYELTAVDLGFRRDRAANDDPVRPQEHTSPRSAAFASVLPRVFFHNRKPLP
jgi:hypothetical protein